MATGKETKAYEDIVNDVTFASEDVLIQPGTADTVTTEMDAMETGAMDTVAGNAWPVTTFTQQSTSGSDEGHVVIPPLNRAESNGWPCNTVVHASKRQKIKPETVISGLREDCYKWY